MFKILFLVFFFTLWSLDAKEPKIELGMGAFVLSYPSYIGSKTTHTLLGPYPHIRYHGDILVADRDGLNGKFLSLDRLKLDFSFGGSLPSTSEGSTTRDGMPDLELSGEAGLKLVYEVYTIQNHKIEVDFHTRAVISTDLSSVSYRGLVANTSLKYTYNYEKFELILRTGLMSADKIYNNYFYGVKQEYVTASRNYYEASSGYNGVRNSIGLSYQKNAWWFGAYISHFNIEGAVFVESPLVETHDAVYMGTSFAYIFYTQN